MEGGRGEERGKSAFLHASSYSERTPTRLETTVFSSTARSLDLAAIGVSSRRRLARLLAPRAETRSTILANVTAVVCHECALKRVKSKGEEKIKIAVVCGIVEKIDESLRERERENGYL